jgi:hypothetical protein
LRVQEKEVEEARWCDFEEAMELLRYEETKEMALLVGMCLDGTEGRVRAVDESEDIREKLEGKL